MAILGAAGGRGRGSWGEMRMVGCPGKSCLSDSEMCSPAGAQQWDGDVFWDEERDGSTIWAVRLCPLWWPPWEVHPTTPALMDPRLVKLSLGLLSPTKALLSSAHPPSRFLQPPDMCFVLAPPKVRSWLESMLSNSEGAFHFLVRSGSFILLSLSHFKDGNRRKHLLLCLENIINVFWLHKPALTENVQTQGVQGG